ncbi:MAG: amidohydrolase family protein, partial [Clostridiaceae bacterium]
SSQPTYEEFIRTVALARVGGMLSGKSGVVNIHLGTGRKKFEYLFRLMEEAEIPISQVLPTHCNREGRVFREAVKFAKLGGNIDLTTSFNPEDMEPEEVRASEAFKKLIENGVLEDNITFSSDGNGSMPTFNEKNEIVGLGICSVASLFQEVRAAVLEHNIPLDKVLKTVTTNPARIFKLEQKGEIAAGKDADIVLLHKEDLSINQVIAKGKIHVKEGKAVIKGTYEK